VRSRSLEGATLPGGRPGSPKGSSKGAPSGVPVVRSSGRARQALDLSHSDRISDQDITVVGRTRGQVLVDARTELDQVLRNPVRTRVRKHRSVLRGSGSSSSASQGTKGQEPGNRFRFGPADTVSERRKAHESSGRGGPRFAAVRISTESKALELRGIVTSWSSEQEHAMSETA